MHIFSLLCSPLSYVGLHTISSQSFFFAVRSSLLVFSLSPFAYNYLLMIPCIFWLNIKWRTTDSNLVVTQDTRLAIIHITHFINLHLYVNLSYYLECVCIIAWSFASAVMRRKIKDCLPPMMLQHDVCKIFCIHKNVFHKKTFGFPLIVFIKFRNNLW